MSFVTLVLYDLKAAFFLLSSKREHIDSDVRHKKRHSNIVIQNNGSNDREKQQNRTIFECTELLSIILKKEKILCSSRNIHKEDEKKILNSPKRSSSTNDSVKAEQEKVRDCNIYTIEYEIEILVDYAAKNVSISSENYNYEKNSISSYHRKEQLLGQKFHRQYNNKEEVYIAKDIIEMVCPKCDKVITRDNVTERVRQLCQKLLNILPKNKNHGYAIIRLLVLISNDNQSNWNMVYNKSQMKEIGSSFLSTLLSNNKINSTKTTLFGVLKKPIHENECFNIPLKLPNMIKLKLKPRKKVGITDYSSNSKGDNIPVLSLSSYTKTKQKQSFERSICTTKGDSSYSHIGSQIISETRAIDDTKQGKCFVAGPKRSDQNNNSKIIQLKGSNFSYNNEIEIAVHSKEKLVDCVLTMLGCPCPSNIIRKEESAVVASKQVGELWNNKHLTLFMDDACKFGTIYLKLQSFCNYNEGNSTSSVLSQEKMDLLHDSEAPVKKSLICAIKPYLLYYQYSTVDIIQQIQKESSFVMDFSHIIHFCHPLWNLLKFLYYDLVLDIVFPSKNISPLDSSSKSIMNRLYNKCIKVQLLLLPNNDVKVQIEKDDKYTLHNNNYKTNKMKAIMDQRINSSRFNTALCSDVICQTIHPILRQIEHWIFWGDENLPSFFYLAPSSHSPRDTMLLKLLHQTTNSKKTNQRNFDDDVEIQEIIDQLYLYLPTFLHELALPIFRANCYLSMLSLKCLSTLLGQYSRKYKNQRLLNLESNQITKFQQSVVKEQHDRWKRTLKTKIDAPNTKKQKPSNKDSNRHTIWKDDDDINRSNPFSCDASEHHHLVLNKDRKSKLSTLISDYDFSKEELCFKKHETMKYLLVEPAHFLEATPSTAIDPISQYHAIEQKEPEKYMLFDEVPSKKEESAIDNDELPNFTIPLDILVTTNLIQPIKTHCSIIESTVLIHLLSETDMFQNVMHLKDLMLGRGSYLYFFVSNISQRYFKSLKQLPQCATTATTNRKIYKPTNYDLDLIHGDSLSFSKIGECYKESSKPFFSYTIKNDQNKFSSSDSWIWPEEIQVQYNVYRSPSSPLLDLMFDSSIMKKYNSIRNLLCKLHFVMKCMNDTWLLFQISARRVSNRPGEALSIPNWIYLYRFQLHHSISMLLLYIRLKLHKCSILFHGHWDEERFFKNLLEETTNSEFNRNDSCVKSLEDFYGMHHSELDQLVLALFLQNDNFLSSRVQNCIHQLCSIGNNLCFKISSLFERYEETMCTILSRRNIIGDVYTSQQHYLKLRKELHDILLFTGCGVRENSFDLHAHCDDLFAFMFS